MTEVSREPGGPVKTGRTIKVPYGDDDLIVDATDGDLEPCGYSCSQ